MINIIIADDHFLVRRGLIQVLSEESDVAVVDEAPNACALLNKINKRDWDIVILDIGLPDRSGLDVLVDLKYRFPKLPVLVLTVYPEEQYATRAFKLGADGYINKRSAPDELIKAVKSVVNGSKYVSPALAEKFATSLQEGIKQPLHETLSNREYQITCMMASGKSLKEIAFELRLSVKTIRTYRQRIIKKMKFRSNAELIRYAIKNELVV